MSKYTFLIINLFYFILMGPFIAIVLLFKNTDHNTINKPMAIGFIFTAWAIQIYSSFKAINQVNKTSNNMEHFVIKTNGSSYFYHMDDDGTTPRFTDTLDLAWRWQEYDKAKEFGQSLLGTHGQTCFQIEKLYV